MTRVHCLAPVTIALVTAALTGCQNVLGSPDYRIEEDVAVAALTLPERFAGSDAPNECLPCLASGYCGALFGSCSESAGCVAYTSCWLDAPSPAAMARCDIALDPVDEDRALFASLLDCYRACVVECEGGDDFSCLGEYTWPGTLPHPTLRLRQTLSYLYEEASTVVGAKVTACGPGTACEPVELDGEPVVAETDASGTCELVVPVNPAAAAADGGFQGFRLVESDEFVPHRLQRNVRIVADQTETTRLVRRVWTKALLTSVNATEAIDAMILQVFDCRSVGAGDIVLEFPDTEDAIAYYKDDVSEIATRRDHTLASQEGAAGVAPLATGRYHRVVARTLDGETVANADVWIPGGEIVLLGMHPRGLSR